ncbi:Imm32 family immunity protein [Kitasatospora viridis]|uniref:Uncharacterized protein n=1 Tax=Kitasatospora viridis TaxID=281105 RepID=A0A561SEL6_9ACTN|nr:hypothetical protein [Kitasatospora viridis]TWF73304.1 hypothetical protein FHX73_16455 [Kitasatospora viridis]
MVPQVLFSERTRELKLSGTRPELRLVGQLLRELAGGCALAGSPDPAPYDAALARFACREEPERDTVSIVADGPVLRVTGGRAALDLFAAEIESFADEADPSDHEHVEHPSFDWVAEGSDPLVLAFTR